MDGISNCLNVIHDDKKMESFKEKKRMGLTHHEKEISSRFCTKLI